MPRLGGSRLPCGWGRRRGNNSLDHNRRWWRRWHPLREQLGLKDSGKCTAKTTELIAAMPMDCTQRTKTPLKQPTLCAQALLSSLTGRLSAPDCNSHKYICASTCHRGDSPVSARQGTPWANTCVIMMVMIVVTMVVMMTMTRSTHTDDWL